MNKKELTQALNDYHDKFGEGPPIWGMEPDDVVAAIREAIETGKPLEQEENPETPEDAIL